MRDGDQVGFGATMFLTLRSLLSVRAVRSTQSMDGTRRPKGGWLPST